MNRYIIDTSEIRECAAGYEKTAQYLKETVKKLKTFSFDENDEKNRDRLSFLISGIQKDIAALEDLSSDIIKAADEYSQNEENTAVLIRKKLFANNENSFRSLIIERDLRPSESSLLYSRHLIHSDEMEKIMLADAEDMLNKK